MDQSKPSPATEGAVGCPVDHGAHGSAAAERATIPSAALPGSRLPSVLQWLKYWIRPVRFLERNRRRYGSRFRVSLLIPPRPIYMLTEPDDVKAMFLAPADVLHTGEGSSVIEKYTGQSGVAWLDEDAHRNRRKNLMPSFHGSALRRIEAAIPEMAKAEVARWPRGRDMPMHPFIHRFTIQVIGEVVFGDRMPKRWSELLRLEQEMMRFNNSIASPMMFHQMPPLLVRALRAVRPLGVDRFFKVRERTDALIFEAIEERRESGVRGDDMLSLLLAMTHDDGSPLSPREIRDELGTMFLAGTETTAGAIAWSFEYLSREHSVREKILDEIEEGESDAYLTAVVYEMLRMQPPLPWIIIREVMKPVEIGGVRYEPGEYLLASPYLLNRSPDVYEDADVFRPERFLGVKPGTYTWIPFGGGRIRCLGDGIALLEMKSVLREALVQCEFHRLDQRPERARGRIIGMDPVKFARMQLRDRQQKVGLG